MSFNTGTATNPHIHLFSVKPSAIAIGALYTHAASFLATSQVFGDAIKTAKSSTSLEQFAKTKEAQSAAITHASSLVGSGIQSYAIASLINWTGVVNYQAAAVLGGLVWGSNAVASIVDGVLVKGVPVEVVVGRIALGLIDTVGLAVVLTWWGTRVIDA